MATIAICLPAAALGHGDEAAAPFHGRMPDQPDVRHVGKKTYRYLPGREEYEVSQPGKPAGFLHLDYTPKPGAGDIAATEGPGIALPPYELDPVCRTSGPRIVVVYTHRPSDGTATPTATLRSIVKRMNWKFADQSSQSSAGKRVVKMAVDCSAGQINVFNVAAASNYFGSLTATVASAIYGEPTSEEAVKYLIFDHSGSEENIAIAGLGGPIKIDSYKSHFNYNALYTAFAVLYNVTTVWESHDTIHELTHALGGSQTSAPLASPGHHCGDGLDALCYADGTIAYFRDYCPYYEGYETPTTVPIDCGKDTYFNAAPEAGSWLANNWDLAGREDWFLTAPPTATTEAASEVKGKTARLNGIVDPEGTETSFYFEYGKTTSYGTKTETSYVGYGPGANGGPEAVYAFPTGLSPATIYHFRAVAINRDGVTVPGKDKTFTTTNPPLPTVTTETATGVGLTEATLKGSVNPNGSETTYQFEYGTSPAYGKVAPAFAQYIGSGSGSLAASQKVTGLEANTIYHFRLKATSEGGTAYGKDLWFNSGPNEWGLEPTPEPAESEWARLWGVSCISSEACAAVGNYVKTSDGGWGSALAKVKSAGKWSLTSVPKPAGALSSFLEDVSCTSASACTAVGVASAESTSTLAERWNGSSWSIQSTPNAGGANSSWLWGVSCVASNNCTAVGWSTTTGAAATLAERWNGTAWSVMLTPNLAGFKKSHLYDVSCVSASDCWAVGQATNFSEPEASLAMHWNGTAWTINSPAGAQRLAQISCASSSSCVATTKRNMVLSRWNGSSWSQETAPKPEGATSGSLSGISCTSSSACTAAGVWGTKRAQPLAESWNGSKWTIQSTSEPAGTLEEAAFNDISCTSATSCSAAGHFIPKGGTAKALVEARH